MSTRAFRTEDSLREEQVTRAMVPQFLRQHGYVVDSDVRVRNGQTVSAVTPDGHRLVMRVKLCWRRGSAGRDEDRRSTYSGAQLMARVEGSDWVGSIQRKMSQEHARGSTHLLFVQRDGGTISRAALIPITAVATIWTLQRDLSDQLIRDGKLGRKTKNHAMNGRSPTLWLQDDLGGQRIAGALWGFPGVVDVGGQGVAPPPVRLPEEVDDAEHYREGACKRITVNAYERDERARRACLEHYGTACTACGVSLGTLYGPEAAGHIHVHHVRPLASIGQAYTVDPIADLRPVCPNCHAVIHLHGGCRSLEDVKRMLAASLTSGAG